MIYLDAAATAYNDIIDDVVIKAMTYAMKEYWQNPSSLYATDVKEKINRCRVNIANFIGAKSDEIYFTSGASESNNLAIRGWVDERINFSRFLNVITTKIEHKSVLGAVQSKGLCANIHFCVVDKYGLVDYESLEKLLSEHKCEYILVSIHMANNEIGSLQDVRKISNLVHKYNGVLHIDATQALGHININVEDLGVDMMSCSGHKITPALKGIGFLYKRNGINIQPIIHGTQENGLRGGTENVFGIIGLSKALDYSYINNIDITDMCAKRDYFIDLLCLKFGCKLNGHDVFRLPNNINVTFPQNITGESLLYTLDMSDIAISVGSACNSQSIEPSHVLKEIGLTDEEAMRTIRITIHEDITYEDIDYVIDEIDRAIKIIEA